MTTVHRIALAVLALSGSLIAAPASSATKDLGALTGEWTWFGNYFNAGTNTFTDYYTFALVNNGLVAGGTFEIDLGKWLNVDIKSVSLSGGSLATSITDTYAKDGFTFEGLTQGAYTLSVSGLVTGWTGGAYIGAIQAIAAPVPEPEEYAVALLGLLGVGALVRAGKRAR